MHRKFSCIRDKFNNTFNHNNTGFKLLDVGFPIQIIIYYYQANRTKCPSSDDIIICFKCYLKHFYLLYSKSGEILLRQKWAGVIDPKNAWYEI